MRYTISLKAGVVEARLEPRVFAELHSLLAREAIDHEVAYAFLRQVAFFDENELALTSQFPGQTVVIQNEKIAFAGTQHEAFEYIAASDSVGVYMVKLLQPDQLDLSRPDRAVSAGSW